jgi:thiol-disulfide isomerase/thioredoxin
MATSNMIKPFNRSALVILFLMIAAGIYWLQSAERKAESPAAAKTLQTSNLGGLNTGALAGLLIHPTPKNLALVSFVDETGKAHDLGQWKGRVVLLNLWATWCSPCKKEMPDLANLQRQLGSRDFEVVALSLDRKGAEASAGFLKEVGADVLKTYVDPESKALAALQAVGLPATLLIDRNGREIGRLLGPAKWDAPEAVALITAAVASK